MDQQTNLHAIRLYNCIENTIGKAAADNFAKKLPLSESATFEQKFKWAADMCEYLENTFSWDDIKKIRMDCSCTPPPEYLETVKKLYQDSENLDEFCERYNTTYAGEHSVWHENGVLFLSYSRCFCDCLHVDGPISKTWCLCSLGFAKKLFDIVLDCNTEAELIESVRTGGMRCVMKITRA